MEKKRITLLLCLLTLLLGACGKPIEKVEEIKPNEEVKEELPTLDMAYLEPRVLYDESELIVNIEGLIFNSTNDVILQLMVNKVLH